MKISARIYPLVSLVSLALVACAEPPAYKVTAKDTDQGATSESNSDGDSNAGVSTDSSDQSNGSGITKPVSVGGNTPSVATAGGSANPTVTTPATTVVSGTTATGTDASKAIAGDVIVQLFNWPFKQITTEMDTLAASGYAQIHVSPPNLTIATNQWWGRYQPVDYRLIAGPLGNETEFKEMIAKAHAKGIKIIIDMVLNHTYNPSSQLPPEAAQLNASLGNLFSSNDFHPAVCITDYNNPILVRSGRMCGGGGDLGMPDLDQNSANVLKVQREFLTRMNTMGVDGYRFDAVKHMDVDYFPKLFAGDLVKDKFVFGEIIADQSAYDRDMAPYVNALSLKFYDFPLRATLQATFQSNGSLQTLIDANLISSKRALPVNRGIVFIMNHDIPNNTSFRGMINEPKAEELAYAYLLGAGNVGVPYVFSDLGIAQGAGLVDDRWKNAHRAPKLVSLVKFHNLMMGEPTTVLYSSSCVLAVQRGNKGLFIINKCTTAASLPLTSLPGSTAKSIKNHETGEVLTLDGTPKNLSVPAEGSIFYVVN